MAATNVAMPAAMIRSAKALRLLANKSAGKRFEDTMIEFLRTHEKLTIAERKSMFRAVIPAGRFGRRVERGTFPDFVAVGDKAIALGEIKNTLTLGLTDQIRTQISVAHKYGMSYRIIVAPKTLLHRDLKDSMTTYMLREFNEQLLPTRVSRYDPITNSLIDLFRIP